MRHFAVYVRPEFRFLRLGWLSAVWLARWPRHGWSFAGYGSHCWLLRCGPVVLVWSRP